ncbi:MAG: SDR family NAD(P)-dependent oxidoreductase [Halobacteriovoraceae bacterium]|nr:SDR family NAD(P)-dependent oxidoreductase [Halobacteriovoraceae bacterium]
MKVFITGGTSGIGLELAKRYIENGFEVGVCGRDIGKIPKELTENRLFHAYQVDVTDHELLHEKVRDFAKGKLDIMIANAGTSVGSKSKIPDFKKARLLTDINIKGVINSFEVAFELMYPHKKGHLVAIASVAGMIGLPGASSYSASKAAVLKLCESFSIDLKEFGIDVTAIAPGFIDTPLTKKNNHKMPFMMSSEAASFKIVDAIEKKKTLYIFPFPMKFVVYLLDRMPRGIYRRLMSFRLFNFSK